MPELEDRIHKRLAKKARIDRKLVRHAASSKPGHFIDTVRLGWNSFSFIFYIGGISAILGGVFGWAGWASTIVTVLFFYYTGKFKENVDKERKRREEEALRRRMHRATHYT